MCVRFANSKRCLSERPGGQCERRSERRAGGVRAPYSSAAVAWGGSHFFNTLLEVAHDNVVASVVAARYAGDRVRNRHDIVFNNKRVTTCLV